MALVPRDRFVTPGAERLAYADEALPIESGQTISQPYIVARMTELLEPHPGMHILEVGTGSGYQAAILAAIGCDVVSIERHEELASVAERRIREVTDELGLPGRVGVVIGDGTVGYPAAAPYRGIVVTAAAPRVPPALLEQLEEGGRLVIPVGTRQHQELIAVTRVGSAFEEREEGPCVFVPLLGAQGFPEH